MKELDILEPGIEMLLYLTWGSTVIPMKVMVSIKLLGSTF
jgi:hypothetical protein